MTLIHDDSHHRRCCFWGYSLQLHSCYWARNVHASPARGDMETKAVPVARPEKQVDRGLTNTEGVQSTSQVQHVGCGVTIESEVRTGGKKIGTLGRSSLLKRKSSEMYEDKCQRMEVLARQSNLHRYLLLIFIRPWIVIINPPPWLPSYDLHQSVDLLLIWPSPVRRALIVENR